MSQHRSRLALGAALALLASTTGAEIRTLATAPAGSVPGGIHYQGRLEDNGIPAQGTRSMRFRLYDALTAGTLLWDSGATAVPITQGIFGTDLAIPVSALSGAAVKYLEVEIEGTVLSPREALGTVPYALIAKTIEGTIDVQNGGLSISSAPTSTNPSVYVSPTTGDVGIGTSSPGASLEVRNTGGTQVLLTGSAGNTGVQFAPSGGFADLRFTTSDGADSKVMRLGGGGDVLTSRGAVLTLQGNEGGGEAILSAGDGGNYILLSNGNVGVNAGTPATRLEVNGDAQFGSGAAKSTFTAAGNLQLVSGSTVASAGTLSISTAASAVLTGTPALFIDGAGRTGLATAAPARTLDVAGDAQFGSGAGKSVFATSGALAIASAQNITMAGNGTVTGLPATPAGITDAASKAYVDAQVPAAGGWTRAGGQIYSTPGAEPVTVVGASVTVKGAFEGQSYAGFGGAAIGNSRFTLYASRNFTSSGGSGSSIRADGTIQGGATDDLSGGFFANNFAEAASGAHNTIAQLHLAAPGVADDAGATTNSLATLYVAGAPTGVTPAALGPFSILVNSGASYFGNEVVLNDPDGAADQPIVKIFRQNGEKARIGLDASDRLAIMAGATNTPAVRVDSTGRVGIGGAPSSVLDVTGASSLRGATTVSGSSLTVDAAALFKLSASEALTFGTNGVSDGLFNAPEGFFFNIDSDNTAGSNVFQVGGNRTGITGGNVYLSVVDNTNLTVGLPATVSGSTLTVTGTAANAAIGIKGGAGRSALLEFGANDLALGGGTLGEAGAGGAGITGSLAGDLFYRARTGNRHLFSTDGGSTIEAALEANGWRPTRPAVETVAAAGTITANACGGVKAVDAAAGVTTSLTDAFTTPAAANDGCCMDVVNVDAADTITVKNAANTVLAGGVDVALGPGDTMRVCSTGAGGKWFQIGSTGNN